MSGNAAQHADTVRMTDAEFEAAVERGVDALAARYEHLFEQGRRHPDVYRLVARRVLEAALIDGVLMPDAVLSKTILDYYRPPFQPFDDEEIDLIVSVSGVPRSKVWVIAWMTTMKLRKVQQFDGGGSNA